MYPVSTHIIHDDGGGSHRSDATYESAVDDADSVNDCGDVPNFTTPPFGNPDTHVT